MYLIEIIAETCGQDGTQNQHSSVLSSLVCVVYNVGNFCPQFGGGEGSLSNGTIAKSIGAGLGCHDEWITERPKSITVMLTEC